MVAAQSDGCAPVVKAFHDGAEATKAWEDAHTMAGGLRVPVTIGGRMMLTAMRDSDGTGVAVSDRKIQKAQQRLAQREGMFVSFEAAATVAAVEELAESNWIQADERVLIFNTGSGLKYRLLLT